MTTIVLIVSLLEGALRTFASMTAEKNAKSIDQLQISTDSKNNVQKRLRILVLGESTTAESHIDGIDISWPEQARLVLQASNPQYKIEIINLAQPGTSTAFLAEELFRRFDEIRPQIIVSMMGINDFMALALREPAWWNSLKFVHFFRWLIQFLGCEACFKVNDNSQPPRRPLAPQSMNHLFAEINSSETLNSSRLDQLIKDFESELSQLQAQPQQQLFALTNLGTELAWFATRDHKNARQLRSSAKTFLLRALEIDPIEPWTVETLCLIQTPEESNCLRSVERMIQAGLPPSNSILRTAVFAGGSKSDLIKEETRRRGLKILDSTPTYEVTKTIYRQIATFARSRGVPYFAMQYPTGSIDGTRSFFTKSNRHGFKKFGDSFYLNGLTDEIEPEFNHVIFVDNLNFNSPEVQNNKTEYFSDMFGRDQGLEFGHTTAKGHRLIAENIASAIQKYLSAEQKPTDK